MKFSRPVFFLLGAALIFSSANASETLCPLKMNPEESRETMKALRAISSEAVRANSAATAVRSQNRVQSRSVNSLYDRNGITAWLNTDLARGKQGKPNQFPQTSTISYCAGKGCPLKIPFTFTEAHFKEIWSEVYKERQKRNCLRDNARCEIIGLQFAARKMDQIVLREKLKSIKDLTPYMVNPSADADKFWDRRNSGDQFVRDCVDQAANGSSFLVVLANRGLMKHNRVLAPGSSGLQTHWYTRIQDDRGQIYRFDLYNSNRSDFSKIPGVAVL